MGTREELAEEKRKWEVGVEVGIQRFKVYVAREIDRIGKLTARPTEKPRRLQLLKKGKPDIPDNVELREEFRAFLRTTKDNVDLYLWFALSNLAERGVDRKLESKVYHLFGDVASTFLYIEQNFDPIKVTPDLLSFLKDRITRIGSPGAFDITGRASVITQSGEGENNFLESVNYLQKLLAEVRNDLSKYFKKDATFEGATNDAVKR
jgi:hypothetical protein